MRGLVLKDLLVLQKSIKTYALFLCGYLVLSALGVFDLTFVTAMTQVILLMLPLSAFAYDEQAKWDRYALTFPMGRRAVVGGRYLFTLIIVIFATAFNLLACLLLFLLGQTDGTGVLEGIGAMLASTGVGLVVAAVMIPLSYQLGPERARPYMYAIIFLPMVLIFGAAKLGLLNSLDLSFLNDLSPVSVLGVFALIPLLSLVGLWVSYLVSCRIVAGKEF